MSKDKQNMGHRYIELFLRSEESIKNWSNNTPMLPQMNNGNPAGLMNSGGQPNMPSSFGGGYGGGVGGNYGSYSSNGYAGGASSGGYSSFSEKTNFSSMPQASAEGNYFNR